MAKLKNTSVPSYDFERPYKAAAKALKRVADESGNELLEAVAHEEDPKDREKKETKCIMVRKVVDECLDEYRKGEYTFKEAISELSDALSYL